MDSDNYSNVWEYRIRETFKKRDKQYKSTNLLWEILSLLIYSNSKDKIFVDIYNFFEDKDQFVKFVSMIDGRTMKMPTKKEIEEALLTSVFFYEQEVNGKSWEEIRNELEFDISSIKYGIKIKNLKNWIKQRMHDIIRREDKEYEQE